MITQSLKVVCGRAGSALFNFGAMAMRLSNVLPDIVKHQYVWASVDVLAGAVLALPAIFQAFSVINPVQAQRIQRHLIENTNKIVNPFGALAGGSAVATVSRARSITYHLITGQYIWLVADLAATSLFLAETGFHACRAVNAGALHKFENWFVQGAKKLCAPSEPFCTLNLSVCMRADFPKPTLS